MTDANEVKFPHPSREQVLWIIGALLLAGWLIWLLAPVLTPFLISAFLAYMAEPVVSRLARHMRRELAVAAVFVLILTLLTLALVLILPILIRETVDLFNRLPAYLEQLQVRFEPLIEEHFGWRFDRETFDAARLRELLEQNFANVAAAGRATWSFMSESGGRFVIWITGMFLIPLVTFYLMRDWSRLLETLRDMLPRNIEPTVVRLARECDEALGGFLRGQLLVMLGQGAIYAVGLWLIGLNNGIAIGMIAGLVSFVPYLGAIIGVLLAMITAIIQNFDFWFLFSVAVVFTIGQLVESFLLTPNLIGDRIGMHPVLVVFMVLAGGQLFGFIGVLLALPVSAAGTVLVRFFYRSYKDSRIYGSAPAEAATDAPPSD